MLSFIKIKTEAVQWYIFTYLLYKSNYLKKEKAFTEDYIVSRLQAVAGAGKIY